MMAKGIWGKVCKAWGSGPKLQKLQESGEVHRKVHQKCGKAAERAAEHGKVEPKHQKHWKVVETWNSTGQGDTWCIIATKTRTLWPLLGPACIQNVLGQCLEPDCGSRRLVYQGHA